MKNTQSILTYQIKYPVTNSKCDCESCVEKQEKGQALPQVYHIQKFKDKNTALLLCDILKDLGVKFQVRTLGMKVAT